MISKDTPVLLRVEEARFPNSAVVRNPLTGRKHEVKQAKRGQLLRCQFRGHRAFCRVVEPAPFETDAFCVHADLCGGCFYPRYTVEQQREEKRRLVAELLNREIEVLLPSPQAVGYRNKMEYSFGDESKGGCLELGMHKKGRHHDVVSVPGCQLVHPDFEVIRSAVLEFARASDLALYQKSRRLPEDGEQRGFYRHLLVRRSSANGDLLVALSATSDPGFPSDAFCAMLLALPLEGRIAGILRIHNDGIADVSSGEVEVLFGRESIVERILGIDFELSIHDFFQTNSRGAERLYDHALTRLAEETSLAARSQGALFLDLFCGTGTIGQIAAKRFPGLRVLGVDIAATAIASAQANALRNGIDAEFVAGDVFDVLRDLEVRPDFMVVDPPRAGVGEKTIAALVRYRVPVILYISCNPVTLKQDLAWFANHGYHTDRVDLVDMFPMTSGVECIALIQRGKS